MLKILSFLDNQDCPPLTLSKGSRTDEQIAQHQFKYGGKKTETRLGRYLTKKKKRGRTKLLHRPSSSSVTLQVLSHSMEWVVGDAGDESSEAPVPDTPACIQSIEHRLFQTAGCSPSPRLSCVLTANSTSIFCSTGQT